MKIPSNLMGVLFAGVMCAGYVQNTASAQSLSQSSISFQAVLNNGNGQALPNGNYSLAFRFYAAVTGGTAIAVTNVASVSVVNGVASTAIPIQAAWFDGQTRYLGVSVNGGAELQPRTLVTAVPYASHAVVAESLVKPGTDQPAVVLSPSGNVGIGIAPSALFQIQSSQDPWRLARLSFDSVVNPQPDSISAKINGGLWRSGDWPPNAVGSSFFKIGGTAHTGEAVPYEFNAGSLALEVATVGPGERYSSAFRFQTLRDSYPNGTPEDALRITGAGDLLVGNGRDNRNHRLVFMGPNAPYNESSAQAIEWKFSSAGTAAIRAWRGMSWDTSLEFMVSDRDVPGGQPIRMLLVNEDGIRVNGRATMTVCEITSDRNAKEGFEAVNTREVLTKVAGLSISRWNYKGDPSKHFGPMAQDFHAEFGVGADDKHIATVDADGVALAAIQGLYQVVRDGEARVAQLETEIQSLKCQFAGKTSQGVAGENRPLLR